MEKLTYNNGETTFTVSEEILFADLSAQGRSGHLGHGLVEYERGKVLAFYPNCSGDKWSGHSGQGWTEYRESTDGGKTWGESRMYPFSAAMYELDADIYAHCEKAVRAPNGDILAFNFICDLLDMRGCGYEPFRAPSYTISSDGGKTWSGAKKLCDVRARIYDAKVFGDLIYVLVNFGKNSVDKELLTVYHIFVSRDNGKTFEDVSALPFPLDFTYCRFYGTLEQLSDGRLIVYSYRDREDEYHLDYVTSRDGGKTWNVPADAYFSKRIRNPQLVKFKNGYFMFGRSGSHGDDALMGHNVIYFSVDGINWDEGKYLKMRKYGAGAYSNAVLVHDGDRERLLVQMSYAYEKNRTNVYHWFIDAINERD